MNLSRLSSNIGSASFATAVVFLVALSVPPPAHARSRSGADACAGGAAISGEEWSELARAAGNGASVRGRLEVIRAAAPKHCFTMAQVGFLMETLSSERALRVDALAALYGRLVEPKRFAEVYATLDAEEAEALRARIGAMTSYPPPASQVPPPPPMSSAPPTASARCYQVSATADQYSRTPELLCIAPRAQGDGQFDLVMKSGLDGKEIARFSLALLEASAQRTKNKDHFGVSSPESSTFNTLAIRFDGVRDVNNGDERGSVLIGKTKLFYRSAR